MAQSAIVDIKAQAGKEQVQGKIELAVDAYVAVVDESICANGKGEIELLMGPKDRVDFLLIRSDAYERPSVNGCTPDGNGEQPYIEYAFVCDDEECDAKYQLKHAHLFAGSLSMKGLPPKLDKVVIDNKLTVDVKISILAARTKKPTTGDCDPANWERPRAKSGAAG